MTVEQPMRFPLSMSRQANRVVGRAVVDHDQVPVWESLSTDRGDCFSDKRLGIVGGHHYRYRVAVHRAARPRWPKPGIASGIVNRYLPLPSPMTYLLRLAKIGQ